MATEKFTIFADPIVQQPIPPNVSTETIFPNVFSPNNDQINDLYFITFNQAVTNFQAQIFNRWGIPIFESTDPNFKWDGKYQGETINEGKYIIRVSYELNGKEEKWIKPILVIK